MRIAIVTTDVREHKRDYGVPIATFGTAPTALLQGLARVREAEVHVISCARQQMISQGKLADNIWFHSLHVPRLGWMRTAYQGCIRAVRKKLKELRPDIVHGQGTELDCALDAVFSGMPNLVTIHGNMRFIARVMRARPFSFLWLAAHLERLTIPRADGVICITQHTKDAVSRLARRAWIVPNATDDSFFALESQLQLSTPARILCVGLISPLKNQNGLLLALDRVAKSYEFEAVFLGYAPPGDSYTEEFERLVKARPWCRHAGFVGRQELKDYLQRSNLLVLPSLEENCPMAVLEAMAAGVPVVASRIGGLPDLIEQDRTGLFCDPVSAESMATAVAAILSNPPAARKMAERAKVRALERFHPDVVARKHMEIYEEVLRSET